LESEEGGDLLAEGESVLNELDVLGSHESTKERRIELHGEIKRLIEALEKKKYDYKNYGKAEQDMLSRLTAAERNINELKN